VKKHSNPKAFGWQIRLLGIFRAKCSGTAAIITLIPRSTESNNFAEFLGEERF